MEGVFEVDEITYAPREVGKGVWAMNLDFESALEEYFVEHIPVKRVARTILRNKTLQKFFNAAPSVSEVAILNKLSALEAEREGGKPRWDPIFVDLDATGHAIMLLNLPSVMRGLIGDGPMRRLIDGFSSLLKDPRKTLLSLVTLPRELPAQETVELYQRLNKQRDVELGLLFVNQVPERPLSPNQAGWLDRVGDRAAQLGMTMLVDDVALARRAMRQHSNARAQITRMRKDIALPLVELPVLLHASLSLGGLSELGQELVRKIEEVGA